MCLHPTDFETASLMELISPVFTGMLSRASEGRFGCRNPGRLSAANELCVLIRCHFAGVKGDDRADRLPGKATAQVACFSEDLKC